MTVLIRQARIIDPGSSYHNTIQDMLIRSGIITRISPSIGEQADTVIDGDDLHVSPGWVDVFANFADPGFEQKETLESGAAAAAAGGFTDVFVIPNTKPVTDNKSQVEYLRSHSASLLPNIHPIGAISRNAEGRELAEMYDMRHSGAAGFSDGTQPVQSAGLLLKALQYVKAFDGVVIQVPDDKTVGPNGLMHEGIVSTRLGLPGKPAMAEELLVARDIRLAEYADSKLHFTGVSSPTAIDLIRAAKVKGVNITCSVTPYHLFFTDEDLQGYDTNLKVYPPIRSRADRTALQKAVVDGTIDCVASHHMPQEYDSKVVEFEYAKNGMIGLETCYSVLKTSMPDVPEERWVDLLGRNARKIFGLPPVTVQADQPAVLTVFQPKAHTSINEQFFKSKSRNSAFLGKTLTGKVISAVNGEKIFFNQ